MRKLLLVLLLTLCSFISTSNCIRLKGHYTTKEWQTEGSYFNSGDELEKPINIDLDYWEKDGTIIIRNTDTMYIRNAVIENEDPDHKVYSFNGRYKDTPCIVLLAYSNNKLTNIGIQEVGDLKTYEYNIIQEQFQ